MNKADLHRKIEQIVQETGTDYIDAVIHFCTMNDLEIETIGATISRDQNLMAKIQEEAEKLHFVKKISRLPI